MAKSIKMGKSYDSVFDMLRETYPEHPEYAENAFDSYRRNQISLSLLMLRTRVGVSREDLAARSGLSVDRIDKMEENGDSVRFNDIVKYVKGLNHTARLSIEDKSNNLAGALRWHFQAIAAIMAKFTEMANGDPDISAGVFEHYNNESKKMQDAVLPLCESMSSKVKSRDGVDRPAYGSELVFEHHSKDGAVLV